MDPVQPIIGLFDLLNFLGVYISVFTVDEILTVENWLIASFGYDQQTIEVLLSSAIDAVGTTAPNRVFTTDLVGFLPRTGNIQTI